jgi:hypothetical protein
MAKEMEMAMGKGAVSSAGESLAAVLLGAVSLPAGSLEPELQR